MSRLTRVQQGFPVGFRKPKTEFTEDRQKAFLEHYAECGQVGMSAIAAGVSESTVLKECKRNALFAEVYAAARLWVNEKIEGEIRKRAITGWEEGVYQKGERVMEPVWDYDTNKAKLDENGEPIMVPATIRRFSDRMLELYAKKQMPEYRDKQQVDVNITGGVLAVPTTVGVTDVDWESKYGDMTVDAEFERATPAKPDEVHNVAAPEHPEGPCGLDACNVCRPTDGDDKPKKTSEVRRAR